SAGCRRSMIVSLEIGLMIEATHRAGHRNERPMVCVVALPEARSALRHYERGRRFDRRGQRTRIRSPRSYVKDPAATAERLHAELIRKRLQTLCDTEVLAHR